LDNPLPILGKSINTSEHYTIVGAGISGLLLGFFLKEVGVSFEIKEKSNSVGGLIDTIDTQYGKVETGANGILWCKEIDYVAKKLNLPIVQPNQKDKKRFFVRNKKLRQFPLNIWETLTMMWKVLIPNNKDLKTVADFGDAYMGKAGTRQILSPGLSGIYGTPADELHFEGASKLLSKIRSYSNWLPLAIWRYRRATREASAKDLPKGLHSFEGGMKTLVDALADHLKEHIQLNQSVDILESNKAYILTPSPHIVGKLVDKSTLSDELEIIEYQSLISASVFFKKSQFSRFKSGFGCLIPRNEGLKSLGVLFSSVIYPDRFRDPDVLCLRCILHDDVDTRKMDDAQLVSFLSDELGQLFGLNGNAIDAVVHRWKDGLPIYNENLFNRWSILDTDLKSNHPNVRLFGNYTGEISVRGACQTGYALMKALQSYP